MQLLHKTLVLFLTTCLLGQSLLWSAPTETQPQNLAEYQQRAKQDIKRTPWINREGKYILGIGGTSVALLIAQQVIHQHRLNNLRNETMTAMKAVQEDAARSISETQARWTARETALKQELMETRSTLAEGQNRWRAQELSLREELALTKEELAATNKKLSWTEIKMNGFKKSAETQVAKRKAAEEAFRAQEQNLRGELAALQARFDMKKSHYNALVYYSPKLDKEFAVYEKLFDNSVSEAERTALRKQLAQEPWLLKFTPEQQKEFLSIIDEASLYRRGTYRDAGDGFMRFLIRQAIDRNMPLYERLIGMCRHVFHSKNILSVGILVALGLASQNASAQRIVNRVNSNFDLFLNATPQELAEMEKNPQLREVCIQGAEALHVMSNMTEEEAAFLKQGLQQAPLPAKANLSNQFNLAY